jgi:phytoene synthase
VLFSPRAQRGALTALFAVYLEIREILRECSDAGVARTKLAWWREETNLFAERKPRHPLSINLVQYWPHPFTSGALFLEVIESAETDTTPPAFQHFEEVERYCRHRGGALLQLAAVLAGAQRAATTAAARGLGTAWQLAEIVIQSGESARHGRVYCAAEDLRKYGLDQHIVAGTHTDTGLKTLLADYAQRAQAYADAASSQPSVESQALIAARVLSGLAQARLKTFAARDYDTSRPPVELSPFMQLLTAWRCARRV